MRKNWGAPLAAFLAVAGLAGAAEKARGKGDDVPEPVVQLDGCLQRTADEGIYVLKTGTTDVEIRGSTGLEAHVGQRVTASGVWMEGRTDASGKQTASTEERDRHLMVAAVRELADRCDVQP